MAETVTLIKKSEFSTGFFIEIECCMCMKEANFGAETEKELEDLVEREDWRNLDSDEYQCIGWWCGCDYSDQTPEL